MTREENITRANATSASDASRRPTDFAPTPSPINLPNFFSAMRFLGSFVLVAMAARGGSPLLVPLLVCLILTDWVDGKLAVFLHQRTVFGARLDSLADVTFYGAMLIVLLMLKSTVIRGEFAWIVPAIASYAVSSLVGLVKFHRVPTYHTRAAKTCWLLGALATLAMLADWSVWPLRIAAAGVVLTNVEAMLITLILTESRVDVASLYHALRLRRLAHSTLLEDINPR